MKILKTKLIDKKIKIRKSIVGAIILATTLWIYTTLNNEYVTFVKVPLKVVVPNNRAIENPIPNNLEVEVKGKGWDIFNLLFFNTSKEIILDLSKQNIDKDNFEIGRQQILKSVRYIGNLESIDVLPDNVEFRTGVSGEYFVNVKPNVKIEPKKGFVLVDGPNVEPEKIRIKGNNNIVSKIKEWETNYSLIGDVSNKFRVRVQLKDTLSSIIKKSRNNVFVLGELEQIAYKTFHDIPYTIINGKAESYEITPNKFDITVKGGITAISNFTSEDIKIILDANDIYNSETATAIVSVELDGEVQLSNTNELFVYAFRNSKEKNMIEFAVK
jgi:hypothetical protein